MPSSLRWTPAPVTPRSGSLVLRWRASEESSQGSL
jgi:hypothetical protein